METVTIRKAKTELSRLIANACQGEEIVIARGSKPVVRLVPIQNKGERKPGVWKGKVKIGPEFFEPLPLRSWRAGSNAVCTPSPIPIRYSVSPPTANPRCFCGLR